LNKNTQIDSGAAQQLTFSLKPKAITHITSVTRNSDVNSAVQTGREDLLDTSANRIESDDDL